MKYIRRVEHRFSLRMIADQVLEYLIKNRHLPERIYLPPEEYVMINFLTRDMDNQMTKFMGIPIEVNYEKQEKMFVEP